MSRAGRRLLIALTVLGALLVAGGAAAAVVDANARSAAAARAVDELNEYYQDEQGFDLGTRGPVLRSMLAESIANDGPMPAVFTRTADGYSSASYGAFGAIFMSDSLQRPWAPRLIVAPIAAGSVLLVTVLLIRAAGWTPRRRTVPGAE